MGTSSEISLMWMSQNTFDDKSALMVMAWSRQTHVSNTWQNIALANNKNMGCG